MRSLPGLILLGALACSSGDDQRPARGTWNAGGNGVPSTTGGSGQAGECQGGTGQAGLDGSGGEAGSALGPAGAAGEGGASGGASEGGAGGQVEPTPIAGECLGDPMQAPSSGQCVRVGDPGYGCNPVTGAPCDTGDGQTCEFDGARFSCQKLPEEKVAPCRPCDPVSNASCTVGFTCRGTLDRCTRYCCDNGDCGIGAECLMQPPTVIGICQAKSNRRLQDFGWDLPPPDAGSDAAPDAGADAAAPADCASCSAQLCADREQACTSDAACTPCLGSIEPTDACYALLSWKLLSSCRCTECNELCPESCL